MSELLKRAIICFACEIRFYAVQQEQGVLLQSDGCSSSRLRTWWVCPRRWSGGPGRFPALCCFFFIKTHQNPERRQPLKGIRASSVWPLCWEFLRWLKLAGGVHLHPLEQSHRERRRALDVPNDWREQEQHRVGCANTFIILRPPTPPPRGPGLTVYNLPLYLWSAVM